VISFLIPAVYQTLLER